MPAILGIAFLVMAALAGGCASQAAATAHATAEGSVRIQIGQRISVEGGALEIAFQAVTSDSRCPKGENCVWEGEAVVALAVRSGSLPEVQLELHSSAKGPSVGTYQEWNIRLSAVEPYPVTGRAIRHADYVATLVVDRGQSDELPTQ